MRKIAANYIFPVSQNPIRNGVVVLDSSGTIIEIIDNNGELKEIAGLEFYNGAIIPGFVNAHCHLELSHLKGKTALNKGIGYFIKDVVQHRDVETEEIIKSIKNADKEMFNNGINAVGDISNTNQTLSTKKESRIYYHTFVETLGLDKEKASLIFDHNEKIKNEFINNNLKASLTPHATYSLSDSLLKLLKQNYNSNDILSIHNQESIDEIDLLLGRNSNLLNAFNELNLKTENIVRSFSSSSDLILNYLPQVASMLLVHNVYSSSEDIDRILKNRLHETIYWVMCPTSNLLIESKLADINEFTKHNCNITIGTDSLASNNKLSVLKELKVIREYFPEINFNEMLVWATLNGAKALGVENSFGSLEQGKKPGLVLLENFDFQAMNINQQTVVKRLV